MCAEGSRKGHFIGAAALLIAVTLAALAHRITSGPEEGEIVATPVGSIKLITAVSVTTAQAAWVAGTLEDDEPQAAARLNPGRQVVPLWLEAGRQDPGREEADCDEFQPALGHP